MPAQPSERGGGKDREQAGPEQRAAAGRAKRTQVQIGSKENSVVPLEIAIEFGDLDKLRRRPGLSGHWSEVPS